MALTHSDSETGINGGSLGWRQGNQLPSFFLGAIGELKKGDFSRPIQSVSGFHIIRVNDTRQNIEKSEIEQMEVRHILVIPNQIIDNETAKQKLTEAREQILSGEEFGEVAKLCLKIQALLMRVDQWVGQIQAHLLKSLRMLLTI